jgi:hypothetical protein
MTSDKQFETNLKRSRREKPREIKNEKEIENERERELKKDRKIKSEIVFKREGKRERKKE